ncbi:MAG: hypothetical protein ACXWUG_04585 [Polyangiales bacterium]
MLAKRSILFLTLAMASMACSSTTEEGAVCDPATDPSCVSADGGGDETSSGGDGSGEDGSDFDVGGDGSMGDAKTDGAVKTDSSVGDAKGDAVVIVDGMIVGCVPGGTQCTDCIDNDKDGKIDWMDPECTSPLDNDESSFATGIPGDNIDPCKQDCWFDGNSGAGDDGCELDARCLVGSKDPKCPYDPVMAADPSKCPPPSAKCKMFCGPLTPKGCDCAGCCEVFDPAGVMHTVKLTSTCTYATLGDATKCPTCAQVKDCTTPCGTCDYCLGKTTLPPECSPPPPTDGGVTTDTGIKTDGSTTDTGVPPSTGCPTGSAACSPSVPCAVGSYCLTGCCIKAPT